MTTKYFISPENFSHSESIHPNEHFPPLPTSHFILHHIPSHIFLLHSFHSPTSLRYQYTQPTPVSMMESSTPCSMSYVMSQPQTHDSKMESSTSTTISDNDNTPEIKLNNKEFNEKLAMVTAHSRVLLDSIYKDFDSTTAATHGSCDYAVPTDFEKEFKGLYPWGKVELRPLDLKQKKNQLGWVATEKIAQFEIISVETPLTTFNAKHTPWLDNKLLQSMYSKNTPGLPTLLILEQIMQHHLKHTSDNNTLESDKFYNGTEFDALSLLYPRPGIQPVNIGGRDEMKRIVVLARLLKCDAIIQYWNLNDPSFSIGELPLETLTPTGIYTLGRCCQQIEANRFSDTFSVEHITNRLMFLSSFYNHSCCPNARYLFPADLAALRPNIPLTTAMKDNCMIVVAMREIAPGDEVTIAYRNVYNNVDKRRTFNNENFQCECTACMMDIKPMNTIEMRAQETGLWCYYCGDKVRTPVEKDNVIIALVRYCSQECERLDVFPNKEYTGLCAKGEELVLQHAVQKQTFDILMSKTESITTFDPSQVIGVQAVVHRAKNISDGIWSVITAVKDVYTKLSAKC